MSADAGASGGLRPLARDFFWLAGSQALLKLLALAFGIFAVRCLGAADYGRYAAALAFAGLFAVATGPGAASFGTREMARDAALVGALVPDVAALRGLLATGVVPLLALVAWATGARRRPSRRSSWRASACRCRRSWRPSIRRSWRAARRAPPRPALGCDKRCSWASAAWPC